MTLSVFTLSKIMSNHGFNIKTLSSAAGLTEAKVREVIILDFIHGLARIE